MKDYVEFLEIQIYLQNKLIIMSAYYFNHCALTAPHGIKMSLHMTLQYYLKQYIFN